ncbi:MAG: hypothetical protein U0640_10000 [Phycisphaerales bacterium]
MPRLPAIRHPIIARLERELRHVSREALLRDVERIEQLAPDIEHSQMYPADWLVFRVTGFRPTESVRPQSAGKEKPAGLGRLRLDAKKRDELEESDSSADNLMPELISGAEILRDLSALAERLCLLAELRQDELPTRDFQRVSALRSAWNVSESTIKRLRKAGLVTRAALNQKDVAVGYVSSEVAKRFAKDHPDLISRTRGKRRVADSLRERMVREALRYEKHFGERENDDARRATSVMVLSPLAIAKRLSQRHAVSVEGVRQMLARDARTKKTFAIDSHRSDRARLAMLRLVRRGATIEDVVNILNERGEQVKPALVRRDVSLARAALLRNWTVQHEAVFSTGTLTVDAALKPRIAREGLNEPWPSDLLVLMQLWRAKKVTPAQEEKELTMAFAALRSRASAIAASLDRLQPSPVQLDEAETSLRWAALLHRKLVATQGRLLLETIDGRAQSQAEHVEVRELIELLRAGVAAVAESVMIFDPRKGGRLAGVAGLAIDRAITRRGRDHSRRDVEQSNPKRAQRVLLPGADVSFLSRDMVTWEKWLELPAAVREVCMRKNGGISESSRTIIVRRYGLDGQPPATLLQLQDQLKLSRIAMVKAEEIARREAWGCLRSTSQL